MGVETAIVDYIVATLWQLWPLFGLYGAISLGYKLVVVVTGTIKGQAPRNK